MIGMQISDEVSARHRTFVFIGSHRGESLFLFNVAFEADIDNDLANQKVVVFDAVTRYLWQA